MDYEYDVFLSYVTKYPHGEWVNDIFYELFESYLSDAINYNVKIFRDISDIKGGMAWENKIKKALVCSKVMVSIFSPSYFQSEYCMREFSVINYRQRQLNYMTVQNPNGLIIALKISDGDNFPEEGRKIQTLNCNNYFRVGEGMKRTPIFVELQVYFKNGYWTWQRQ